MCEVGKRFVLSLLTAVVVLITAEGSVYVVRQQERRSLATRVDAAEKLIEELEDRLSRAESDYKCRVESFEKFCRSKNENIEQLAKRDYDWLTNKINFLGILLGMAAILGVGIPLWGGGTMLKALRDIKKARMGNVLASKLAKKARELTETYRRNQAALDAKNFYETSKNDYYLFLSLSGKVDPLTHFWNGSPNTLSAVREGLLEMRRDFMVQALICMNQAMVHNIEAGAEQAIIRTLRQLKVFYDALNRDGDSANIANKMNRFVWQYNASQVRSLLKDVLNVKVDQLLLSYEQLVATYGKTI